MTVHHEEGVLLRRDRNSPATRAEDLRVQLRYPVGIDLFGRDQACWRKEANFHIDQPDFCQQEPSMKRLQGGTAALVPMHGYKENRESAGTPAVHERATRSARPAAALTREQM